MDDCRRWLPSLRSSSFSRCWYWSLIIFPGKFISLSVGDGVVWGLGSNRDLFYRHAVYAIIFVFCHFLNQFWFKVHFLWKNAQIWHRQEHGEQLAESGAAQRDKDCLQTGAGDLDNVYHFWQWCWSWGNVFCNKKSGWSVRGHFGRVWQGQQPLLQDQD